MKRTIPMLAALLLASSFGVAGGTTLPDWTLLEVTPDSTVESFGSTSSCEAIDRDPPPPASSMSMAGNT